MLDSRSPAQNMAWFEETPMLIGQRHVDVKNGMRACSTNGNLMRDGTP